MNKQAYNYLNSVRVLHWEWLRLKAKHDELETCLLPSAIRYDKDKVQTSPEDPMAKIVSEIADLERRMGEIQYAKSVRIHEISRVINALESKEERTALTMRYINRKSVTDIAEAMGYSERRIYQFMDQGGAQIKRLQELQTSM